MRLLIFLTATYLMFNELIFHMIPAIEDDVLSYDCRNRQATLFSPARRSDGRNICAECANTPSPLPASRTHRMMALPAC